MRRSAKLSRKERKALGDAIFQCRKLNNFSQQDLADKVGISVKHLDNMEKGRSAPSLAMYVEICRVLGLGNPPMMQCQGSAKNPDAKS